MKAIGNDRANGKGKYIFYFGVVYEVEWQNDLKLFWI